MGGRNRGIRAEMAGRTQQRDKSRFHAVFWTGIFLNSLMEVLVPSGAEYSGVHAAIFLKLPSVAILPWG